MPRASRDTIHAVARLSPRHALSAPEAALFVGISETLFRELVQEGVMPVPGRSGPGCCGTRTNWSSRSSPCPVRARRPRRPSRAGTTW